MRARTLLKYSSRFPLVLVGPICILVAIAAGTHASLKNYQWPVIRDWGTASALDRSSFVLEGIIWRPRSSGGELLFQPLDPTATPTAILPYPDIEARRWQAIPAEAQSYNLIWLEQDGRLRSALIRDNGETLRGPIELAAAAEPDFVVTALPDGSAVVLWINSLRNQLSMVVIDRTGRPGPVSVPLSGPVRHIAAALDQAGALHLAWLSSSAAHEWSVYTLTGSAADLGSSNPYLLYEFSLTSQETVASVAMGLDRTHSYVFWSTTDAAQPEVERIQVLSFPLDHPEANILSEVQLPRQFKPDRKQTADDLTVGFVDLLAPSPGDPAALRWIAPAPGQHSILPAALALQTPDGWRPGVVYFQDGALLGFQITAPDPADAGPPVLAVDAAGDLFLAWQGLTGALPHLFTASTGGRGLAAARQHGTISVVDVLAGVLVGMPWALAWLLIPTCVIIAAPRNTWTPPLAFALYGGAKLLWPHELFAHLSPLLASAGLDRFDPRLVIYTATLGIATLSLIGYSLLYRRPLWQRWLAYVVFDASLTWILFGTNLAG
jgi:hypothetical protein